MAFLWTTWKHVNVAKNPNKNAAANKISTATNYDPESPILTNFGNGKFALRNWLQSVAQFLIIRAAACWS